MHKITGTLGTLDEVVRQIEEYQKKLDERIRTFLSKLLETGVDVAKAKVVELGAVDSRELLNSLAFTLYREGNRGILFTDCSHACYVEFGTGIRGAASPHPTLPWVYDANGHGETGWYYYDAEQGRVRFTKGMPSRPFLYETSKQLEDKAKEVAKEVFAR